MAQLGNLLVKGSSRFLNKAYFEDVYICGDVSTGGKLDITANEGKSILSLNGKRALEVYDTWLNINESGDFTNGIYCGSGVLRTDGEFQVSNRKTGVKFKVNNSSLASYVPSTFSAQATFNGGLVASSANISEEICNTLIVKDELRSAKWNIDNITNLGSTFYVSPCIVFTNPSVYVNSISGTTVVLTITDNSITSSTIGGATWTSGSKVKLMGRIGNSALGTINGVLKRDLNSSTAKTAYISLDFPNTDLIKFSAGATYSGSNVGDLKMMMYEVNKNVNGTTKNRPIGILLSSYGENKKPCIDIYNGDIEDGSPVARMGYLNGLPSINGVSPTGYGFYAAGNAYFSGTLVSSSGKIGGFSLSKNSIQNGSLAQSGGVLICTGTNSSASIGGSDSINGWCFTASNTFGVTKTGALYATSGKIGGFKIDSTYLQSSDGTVGLSATSYDWAFWAGGAGTDTAKFRVNRAGKLWASNATIAGEITATSGKIGKYRINDYLITGYNSTCTGMGGDQAFWAGNEISNNAPFHVSYDGSLYASKANISGIINSTDGSIGGWKISSGSLSSGKTYQGETYDIYLNSSGKIIASNENKYNNSKIIFGIFPEIYRRSVYDAGIQILNKEGTNSLLMHDQIVFSRMDDMSDPFQKTAQMTKYDYEGIKFGWAWNVKNGNDWSETTIKSQIYWNEDDSTINFNGADISLNDGKWLYLQKGCIVLKNNAYIYTTTKENNRISLIGYSASNTLWVGDYSNFTGGNCIITANNVYKNASGSWTSLSDARYKHDFKEISHATDFILGLNPCLYKFNDGTSDRYHMGFKAQEVEKNMLSTIGDTGLTVKYNCTEGLDVDLNNPETYMIGLRYDELIAPLIQVVQEQQYKIQELEKKVTALSN